MNKFLKVLKISLYVILVATLIGILVCYIAFPNETRVVFDRVYNFLNTPFGITGLSVFSLGYIGYKIISQTSIGKKGLGTLKNDFSKVQNKVAEYEQVLDEKIKDLAKKENDIKVLVEGYSTEIDKITESLVKVCETSPNAKIKALGEDIKGNINQVKQEIKTNLEQKGNEYAEVINDKVDLIKSLEEKYDALLEEIKALKESVNYGESEN